MPTPLPLQELPPLSSLKGFEAAARLLSLRAAATELHLTHPAIVNQIQRLEQNLGVKLFAREGRHIILTDAGQRFYPVVREALTGLAQGAKALRQMQQSQPLTVQVYVTTSIRWLAPRLADFQSAHPDVKLKLMTCSIGWEFDEANADVGIVFRDGPLAEHLHWQPLFESRLFPVCSPQMLEGCTLPLPDETLKTLPLIGVYTEGWNWDSYFQALGLGPCPSRNCIVVDTLIVALEMAARAEGVALVNGPFADEDLLSGRLVNPTGQVIAGGGAWGAVCHRKLAQDARVATFLNWLHIQSEASPSQVCTK
ncbi:LysR substrate-binding domain-containing protein [Granulosicoccus antarcticus]|uniref:Glycine cleavage system transcriptional activator n=1 Tax=Granulosicoccus antarcticus IMCC3135 TaxID=1192854 RepID=A0A2Z2NHY6_9GAMM|nr:LysR substrate-binding domain-containing protein [Granulosicoccus antarcticus]ASJ70663.1 Glycine cleavage system transcriptional activator [Granulosicoccus antarcticus IMCC3135]